MPKRPAHRARHRPPFFHPVPVRARADGWSEERQCGFLAQLYITGSVTAAAHSVGMTPKSAYRLRARSDAIGFAHAWDQVLTPPGAGRRTGPKEDFRKVTNDALKQRLVTGFAKPVISRGRMIAINRKPDDSALFRLLRRERAARGLDRWKHPPW